MAKKRKASSGPSGPSGPKDFNPSDARLTVSTYEDLADDQEQYFMDKDKIMLEDEPRSKRLRTQDRVEAFLEESEEEILENDDSSDDDEEEEPEDDAEDAAQPPQSKQRGQAEFSEDEEQNGDEEEDQGYWGDSKKEYYNADAIETEADALEEEAEAKRLQKKKLATMDEADFMFDEDEWAAPADDADGHDVVTEELKDIEVTDDMGPEERYRLLQARYPEFDYLADEFQVLQPQLAGLQKEAEGKPTKSVEVVKFRALTCYVAALSCYFGIMTSPSRDSGETRMALSPAELHDHEVMETLVETRKFWHQVKDLKPKKIANGVTEIETPDEDTSMLPESAAVAKAAKKARKVETNAISKKKKAADKEKKARAKEVEESLADLNGLLDQPKKIKKAKAKVATPTDDDDVRSDFGEDDTIDARTAADKAAKKKSLRFYTSQITQKASKRADAGRVAGGDADIPYRERLKDRQIRLNAEAERRGKRDSKTDAGAELGGDDSDADNAVAKQVRGEEDDYYDMIAHRTKAKKEGKTARKEALAAAGIADRVVAVEEVGPDGKRKINYQIEKNKGLAPRRKKDVRNPRVKKRKKYEAKQKKLSSMKAVYKGGEGRGGYKGETSGIKTNLIKSVKL